MSKPAGDPLGMTLRNNLRSNASKGHEFLSFARQEAAVLLLNSVQSSLTYLIIWPIEDELCQFLDGKKKGPGA